MKKFVTKKIGMYFLFMASSLGLSFMASDALLGDDWNISIEFYRIISFFVFCTGLIFSLFSGYISDKMKFVSKLEKEGFKFSENNISATKDNQNFKISYDQEKSNLYLFKFKFKLEKL